jgi:hypothetical protein
MQKLQTWKLEDEDGCLLGYSALMMEAARTCETLVNFYQTIRRYNPEDSNLRTHRRENLKSYTKIRRGFRTYCIKICHFYNNS